jgi:hypothetical protein
MTHALPEFPRASVPRRVGAALARVPAAMRRNLAAHDWLAGGFHLAMWARVAFAPDSGDAAIARRTAVALSVCTLTVLVLTRGDLLPAGRARALFYRLGLFVPTFLSYFELRYLLPALRPDLLDLELHGLDTTLFGVSPAVYLDRFVAPGSTEWFAFFYYSYFYILAAYLTGSLFFDRQRRRLGEIMAGATIVVCFAHFTYTLVPGMGPHAALVFENDLVGGFWWNLVASTVSEGGAQLDIFPSLHTAFPTYFLLHAIRHRETPVFAVAWPITAFFVANIIIATLFLRWHWGVDILAGLALAAFAHRAGVMISAREVDRASRGAQPVWEPYLTDAATESRTHDA